MRSICFLFLSLVLALNVRASTITSNGTGGGNWSATATWSGGTVPGTGDDVVIAASDLVNVNTAATVLSVSISSSAIVNMQANLSLTSTASDALKFLGVGDNIGLLTAQGTTACTFFDAGGVSMSATSGNRGSIIMKNAAHIFEVQGNLSVEGYLASSPGMDMQNGSTLKLTGTATAAVTTGTIVNIILSKMEIGDGTNSKTVNLPAAGGYIRMYNSGTITVKNAATLNCNGFTGLNGNSPGTGVSLNILNGATVYTGSSTTGTANNIFPQIALLNSGLADAAVSTGTLAFYIPNGVSAPSANIPSGTIGNLIFSSKVALSPSFNWNVVTNGSGPRTLRILGDFTGSPTTAGGSGYFALIHLGSYTASDAPNVTWEFAGSNQQIIYGVGGISLCSGSAAGAPKVLISGNCKLSPESSTNPITFGDITVAANAGIAYKAGLTSSAYSVNLPGNVDIGSGGTMDFSGASGYLFANPYRGGSNYTASYTGAGTLKARNISSTASAAYTINSSLANLVIAPGGATVSNYLFGYSNNQTAVLNFNQTSGTLTFDNPGAGIYVTQLNVGSSLTFNNLVVTAGTLLECSYTMPVFKINGNISFGTGARFRATSTAGTSNYVIELAGTTAQTISCDAIPGAINFQRLKINNPAGVTISSGTVSVGKDQGSSTIQSLNLTAGLINTSNAANLVVLPTTSIINASNTSYVNGPMRMYASWKPIQGGSTQFATSNNLQFPVGKAGRLQQIAFTNVGGLNASPASGSGNYADAEYFPVSYGSNTTVTSSNSPAMISTSYKEYWNLSPSTISMVGNVKLFWTDNYNSAIFNKGSNYLRVAHWTGSTWNDEGNDIGTASAAPGTSGSIQSVNTLSNFSPFTFGTTSAASVPLPNTFISLVATAKDRRNELTWTVLDETGMAAFSIERSKDGKQFSPIAQQKAQRRGSYSYADATPAEGGNFYRIRALGNDGSSSVSQTVRVANDAIQSDIAIFPNPFTDEVNVMFAASETGTAQLTDAIGNMLLEAPLIMGKARFNTASLTPGIYFVSYGTEAERVRMRIVRQ